MEAYYEEKYHLLEKEQWWFRARRDAIVKFISDFDKSSRILDVGCSTGLLLEDLKSLGFQELYGIDVSKKAVQGSIERGFLNSFVMNGEDPKFELESFDIVISSDSLEHMEFDEKAIRNWFKLLKPNGTLIVFVPAFMFLWSTHDVVNQHYRRYTKKSLQNKIEQQGFVTESSGYWNFTLFFPVSLIRMLKKLKNERQKDDLNINSNSINRFLYSWMRIENNLLRFINFPVGVSTFCIAKKPLTNKH